MSSTTTTRAKVSEIAGAVSTDLAAAGGGYKVALFYNGAELSGNNYSRKLVENIGTTTTEDDAAYVTMDDVAEFTAIGGDWNVDEVRLYDLDGIQLRHSREVDATILDGEEFNVTIRFRRPADSPSQEQSVNLSVLARSYDQSATYDCGDSFARAMKIRRNGQTVRTDIPAGVWRVASEVFGLLTATEQSANDALLLCGSRPENELQGTNQYGLKPSSVILLDWDDEAQWLYERLSDAFAENFGMTVLEKLVFQADRDKRVSGFSLGATDAYATTLNNEGTAVFRGLIVEHCRFDQQAHYWDYSYATPQQDLYDADPGNPGTDIRHRRRADTWLRVDHSSSVWIERNCFRGAARHVDIRGDLVTLSGNQYILGGHGLVKDAGTQAKISDETFEDFGIIALAVSKAIVTRCTIEVGYDNQHEIKIDDAHADSADFTLAALYNAEGTTWSIDRDDTRIEFASLGSEDMRDYLVADSIIEVTPTTSGEDPRCFMIESVDATGATLKYTGLNGSSANPCNVPRDIAGIASGIRRIYYLPALFHGTAVEVSQCSFETNQDRADLPLFAVLPERDFIQISDLARGASMDNAGGLMIRHHQGGPSINTGGLVMSSAYHQIEEWDHPRAFRPHRLPYLESSARTGWWIHDDDYQFKIRPGCGVSTSSRIGDELSFRRASAADPEHPRYPIDPTYLPYVFVLTDLQTQNYFYVEWPDLSTGDDWEGVQFRIRLRSDTAYSGADNLRLRIATNTTIDWLYYDVTAAGWQNIDVTMPAGSDRCWIANNRGNATPMAAEIEWLGYNRP